jgi:hypothetical protein
VGRGRRCRRPLGVSGEELRFPGEEIEAVGEVVFQFEDRLFFLPVVEVLLADEHGDLLQGAEVGGPSSPVVMVDEVSG